MAVIDQALDRSHGERQGEELIEEQKDHHAESEADQEVDQEGASSEGGRGGREENGGRENEAAAEADQGDQHGEAAEDQDNGAKIGGLAFGQIAPERHDSVSDRQDGEPARHHDRHGLRADPVVRGELEARHVPPDHPGEREQRDGDHEACHVGLAAHMRLHRVFS